MLSRVQEARRRMDALRSALLSPAPEPIEQALPPVEEAIALLEDVRAELRSARPAPQVRRELRAELRALGEGLWLIQRLAVEGARFSENWARLLGVLARGYTSSGEAAPLVPESQWKVEA